MVTTGDAASPFIWTCTAETGTGEPCCTDTTAARSTCAGDCGATGGWVEVAE